MYTLSDTRLEWPVVGGGGHYLSYTSSDTRLEWPGGHYLSRTQINAKGAKQGHFLSHLLGHY